MSWSFSTRGPSTVSRHARDAARARAIPNPPRRRDTEPHGLRHRPCRPEDRLVRWWRLGQPSHLGGLARRPGLVGQQALDPCLGISACQRQTVVFDFPAAAMMACVPRPSEVSSTIRARQTCFWAAFRSVTIASSLRWSEAETVMEIPVASRRFAKGKQTEISNQPLPFWANPLANNRMRVAEARSLCVSRHSQGGYCRNDADAARARQ